MRKNDFVPQISDVLQAQLDDIVPVLSVVRVHQNFHQVIALVNRVNEAT